MPVCVPCAWLKVRAAVAVAAVAVAAAGHGRGAHEQRQMQQPVVETAMLGSIAATDFSSVAGLGALLPLQAVGRACCFLRCFVHERVQCQIIATMLLPLTRVLCCRRRGAAAAGDGTAAHAVPRPVREPGPPPPQVSTQHMTSPLPPA